MFSIIVPAHNEAAYLPTTLATAHQAAQTLGEAYEIVVVDDGSTDATAAVATEGEARVHRIHARQIASARNAGAAVARGSYLFFVDADTHVNAELLRAGLAAMRRGAVGGGARSRFVEPVPPKLRGVIFCWNTISRLTRWAAGCFLFARRDAFERVGGFSERLYAAEEIELSAKLKRVGPFGILRQQVSTSPRKLQTYTLVDHFAVLGRTIATGGRILHDREGLDIWYAVRQEA